MAKSKSQLLNELIDQISNAGDLVINFENMTDHKLYLYKEGNGLANYTIKIVTREQANEIIERNKGSIKGLYPFNNDVKIESNLIIGNKRERIKDVAKWIALWICLYGTVVAFVHKWKFRYVHIVALTLLLIGTLLEHSISIELSKGELSY